MAGSVSNSWLGFSLTPQANFTTNPTSTANPNNSNAHDITNPATSTTNPPASNNHNHNNNNNNSTNAGNAHNSQLNHSDMVLRSDGSLCIMEALTRSNHAGIYITSSCN